MSDFLEDKKREIRDRLAQLREAVQEAERLEAALAALEGVSGSAPTSRKRAPAKRSSSRSSSNGAGGKRGRPKGSGPRAKQALQTVKGKPGITIPELAETMGMQQNYLYRVMPDLQKQGLVRKEGRGWHAMDAA
jgi:CRP-like cAMP-binding protein